MVRYMKSIYIEVKDEDEQQAMMVIDKELEVLRERYAANTKLVRPTIDFEWDVDWEDAGY